MIAAIVITIGECPHLVTENIIDDHLYPFTFRDLKPNTCLGVERIREVGVQLIGIRLKIHIVPNTDFTKVGHIPYFYLVCTKAEHKDTGDRGEGLTYYQ